MSLVETTWVENNLSNIKLIDCSWHLPNASRNPYQEYLNQHLPNALFFDLDKNSDENSELPHMLPSRKKWDEIVSGLGIKNEDRIIVYDNSNLISSCRLWYTFIYFGHDPKLVSVLNGGFEKWQSEKRQTTKELKIASQSKYISKEKEDLVKSKRQIEQNIFQQEFKVLDARSKERFEGNFTWMWENRHLTGDENDGYDTIEWASKLQLGDGQIGTWGHSNPSWHTWLMISSGNPKLNSALSSGMAARTLDLTRGIFEPSDVSLNF